LPAKKKWQNLDRIAAFLHTFDIVGLQEVDSGGSRSEFIDQTEYLAYHAGFPYWSNQVNRRLGRLALHSNGLLSRLKPQAIHDYKLPGLPGRGALLIRFGASEAPFYLCILHLALSRRGRKRQLGFVSELIRGLPRVIVMGDLNCDVDSPEMIALLKESNLVDPVHELKTFPSWNPKRKLDHLLVTPDLRAENVRAINFLGSDHLPVAMDIFVPKINKKSIS
jgi:endonuclease/exonuclease/phosphatase family metal-dependent hydrolase